jgi:hypothetical protein
MKSSAAFGFGTVNSRSYKRTVAGTACAADTQWIVPLTLRSLVPVPLRVSGS